MIRWLALAATAILVGCVRAPEAQIARAASPDCAPEAGLSFVCGTGAVEELVAVEGTDWLIGGRLNFGGPSGFVAINTASATAHEMPVAYAAPPADCPAPPDRARWSFDGLALSGGRLFAANHGGREAIEVFEVTTANGVPALRWTGCRMMPASTLANALAADGAGGVYITSFHDPRDAQAWARLARGEPTGSLLHWSPGSGFADLVFRLSIAPLSGANGVAVGPDGAVYVSAWAASKIIRFDPAFGTRTEIDTDFLPDNLHFDSAGRLLVGGQRARVADIGACGAQCPQSWLVARFDPADQTWEELAAGPGSVGVNYACGAQDIGGEIWMTLRGASGVAMLAEGPAR